MKGAETELELFLEAFKHEVMEHLFYLGGMYGDHAIARLLNDPDYNAYAQDLTKLNLDDFDLGSIARLLYLYAIEGVLIRGRKVPALDDALKVMDHLYRTNVLNQGGFSCEDIYRKAMARARVDENRSILKLTPHDFGLVWPGCDITIDDVAWLCDMTPGSVRNHTATSAKDPLSTYREEGKVYVDPKSLVEWLQRRRGYKETEVVDMKEEENPSFQNFSGLMEFISVRMDNLNIKFGIAYEAIDEDSRDLFMRLYSGDLPAKDWTIDFIIALAKVLDAVDGDFIERATSVITHYKINAANLSPKAKVIPFKTRGDH